MGQNSPDYQLYQENLLERRPEGQDGKEPSGRRGRSRGGRAALGSSCEGQG